MPQVGTKRHKLAALQRALFTGRGDELNLFRALLPLRRELDVDILVVYGIGGIGKSLLLNEFGSICRSSNIPVALLDGRSKRSIFAVIDEFRSQLGGQKLTFPQLASKLKRYHVIQNQVMLSGTIPPHLKAYLSKGRIEGPGGSYSPSDFKHDGGDGRSVIDAIYTIVGRTDGDFFLQPETELTAALIADINDYAKQNRIVMMFDTYEVMGALDNWVRDDLFINLAEHALLVISGRERLEGREWDTCRPLMLQHELGRLRKTEALEYLNKRGVVDDALVEQMVTFAAGHPLTLSLLAEVYEHGDLGDLKRVPGRRDVIRLFIEWVVGLVSAELKTALEICSVLRHTTEESLAYMLAHYSENEIGSMPDTDQDEILRLIKEYEGKLRLADDPKEQARCRKQILELREQLQQKLKSSEERPTRAAQMFAQLQRFHFVKADAEGLSLHDVVWAALAEDLRWRAPKRFKLLHHLAAEYYKQRLASGAGTLRQDDTLEHLFHSISADEKTGILLFQQVAEELANYRLVGPLRDVLNDMRTQPLQTPNSRLWLNYYEARLAYLEARFEVAEAIYQGIADSDASEPKLRAYALCDWGELLAYGRREARELQKAVALLEQSLSTAPPDRHTARNFLYLAGTQRYQGKWEREVHYLEQAKMFYEQCGDKHGLAYVYIEMRRGFGRRGIWKDLFLLQQTLDALSEEVAESAALKSEIVGGWSWAWSLAGRLSEAERKARHDTAITRSIHAPFLLLRSLRDLGWALGFQGRYQEAHQCLTESMELAEGLSPGHSHEHETGYGFGFQGAILLRQGQIDAAEKHLRESLSIKVKLQDALGKLEVLVWLGNLLEIRNDWAGAEACYSQYMTLQAYHRNYFNAQMLVGWARAKYAQHEPGKAIELLDAAEAIALQYEYNDVLSSLNLLRGHMHWTDSTTQSRDPLPHSGPGQPFEGVLAFYQRSLIFGLRYNRFLLDQVCFGKQVTIPDTSILAACLVRGSEGRSVLTELRNWWLTGSNSDSKTLGYAVSPIPEGITLLEAEQRARALEPGDQTPQMRLADQLSAALLWL